MFRAVLCIVHAFFLKLLNMLREYSFCLQSFNLLNSLLCSFVGQKRRLGLILSLGMQSRSSQERDSTFCCCISVAAPGVTCRELPGSLGQVATDLLEGLGQTGVSNFLHLRAGARNIHCPVLIVSCRDVRSCRRTLQPVTEAGSCWC